LENIYNLVLDLKQNIKHTEIVIPQLDNNTHKFNMKVTQNGNDYVFEDDITSELAILKTDGNFVVLPTQKTGSTYIATLTEQALTTSGITKAELRFKKGDELLTSTQFSFLVREVIVSNKHIESTSVYKALDALLAKSEELTKKMDEGIKSLSNVDALKAELSEINAQIISAKNELTQNVAVANEKVEELKTATATANTAVENFNKEKSNIDNLNALVNSASALNNSLRDLNASITEGKQTKTDLDGSIATAKDTMTNLDSSISTGQGLNDSLFSKIQSATTVDGAIKSKMDTVQGWIDNPQQFKGDKGDRGDVGPKGETGDPGPKGDPGKTGVIGPQGPQGEPGPMGQGLTILGRVSLTTDLPSVGDNGDAYFVGTHLYVWTGSKWEDMGEVKGDKGDTGPQGLKGEDGKQGPPGPKGEDGKPGVDGRQGIDGKPGKDGVSVTHSWNGSTLTVTSASGTSSVDLKGPKGDRGPTGPKGDPATNLVKSVQGKTGDVMLTKEDITALGIPAQDSVYDDRAIKADIGKKAYKTELPTKLSDLAEDSTHRTVTDSEKSTWSGKQDRMTKESVKALGFPEHVVLTQAQYDALSSTQKADSTVFYYIKK
jgi:hypothetical protein